MEKKQFYNEYLVDEDYYRLVKEDVSPGVFAEVFDGLYENAKVDIAHFSFDSEGNPLGNVSGAPHYESVSLSVADKILRNSAAYMDGDESVSWMVVAKWSSQDRGKDPARFITRVKLNSMDRDNPKIIEQRMVDTFISCYEKKLADDNFNSFRLDRMMRLPEVRGYMMEESEKYLSHDVLKMRDSQRKFSEKRQMFMEEWVISEPVRKNVKCRDGR